MDSKVNSIKKLTERNKDTFFNEKPAVGEVFTYSDFFFPMDVVRLAFTHGVGCIYCIPSTEEYKKYGCQTMKVIPYSNDPIETIINNRKTLTGDWVATSHSMPLHEYTSIMGRLMKLFKNHTAEFADNIVTIRIPRD